MVFEKIEGSVVIIAKGGVQQQCEAWHRKKEIFCKVGSGFVGVRRNGTSVTRLQLIDFDLGSEHEYAFTATGRMVMKDHPDADEASSYCKYNNDVDREIGIEIKAGKKRRA